MPSVCVIGAGVSGLVVLKELRAIGCDVVCYEMMPRLGGVFASAVWKDGQLTSSSVFTWYSDFPLANRQQFLTWEAWLVYLESYAEHFGLRPFIHLDCKVTAARRVGDYWSVQIHQANWSNGHPFHPAGHQVEEAVFTRQYDHLVICAGLHHVPRLPSLPGLETFPGQVLHSSAYREAEALRGKRVVVVGSGESAADIALQVARVAAGCLISMRSAPGTLFPRWIRGSTPDSRDDRLTYNLPRRLVPLILRGHRAFYYRQRERPELFRWAADSNMRHQRCPLNTNACKSFGIPEAVLDYGAQIAGPIRSVEGSRIVCADGCTYDAEAIIFCTGFTPTLPFLEPALAATLTNIKALWKSVVHPDLGTSLFLVGFSRPHQINLVSIAEMQARLVAHILGGTPLPTQTQMTATIQADQAWMQGYFGDRYEKNPALVDFMYYMESVAAWIGCSVPTWRALRDPRLWLKLQYAAMNGAHYRLQGPGSDWHSAAQTIKATPFFKDTRDALRRWMGLSLVTCLSSLWGLVDPEWQVVSRRVRRAYTRLQSGTPSAPGGVRG